MKNIMLQIAVLLSACGALVAQSHSPQPAAAGGGAGAPVGGVPAAPGDDFELLESLKLNSPFGRLTGDGKGGSPEEQQAANVKLQGIVRVDGVWLFSLADVKEKRSEWAQLGETKLGCMVQSYDPKTGILGVSINGRNYPISLKERDSLKDTPPPPPQGGPPPGGRRGFRSLPPEKRKEFLQNAIRNIDREIAERKRNAAANSRQGGGNSGRSPARR